MLQTKIGWKLNRIKKTHLRTLNPNPPSKFLQKKYANEDKEEIKDEDSENDDDENGDEDDYQFVANEGEGILEDDEEVGELDKLLKQTKEEKIQKIKEFNEQQERRGNLPDFLFTLQVSYICLKSLPIWKLLKSEIISHDMVYWESISLLKVLASIIIFTRFRWKQEKIQSQNGRKQEEKIYWRLDWIRR